jgi:hypothetical protein
MFGFGKGKQKPAPSEDIERGEPLLAAALLAGETFDFNALAKRLATLPALRGAKIDVHDGTLSFQAAGEIGAIALMPAPYPWSDLEGPCETSWMWPEETPATTVRAAKTHLLITVIGGTDDGISRRLLLTQMAADVAASGDVLGIYWPEATLVHFPPVFIEMAKSASDEAPPLLLWIDFRVFANEDGTMGLFTTGMQSIGHMELEIPRITMQPGELREWAMNIAAYLLDNGPVLKDGNTIGATAEAQLRITHADSMLGREEKAIRMEMIEK